jgi:hypothetical protein
MADEVLHLKLHLRLMKPRSSILDTIAEPVDLRYSHKIHIKIKAPSLRIGVTEVQNNGRCRKGA